MATAQLTGHLPVAEGTMEGSRNFLTVSRQGFSQEIITGTNENLQMAARSPITYEGEMPVFYPAEMIPGVAYNFSVYGNPVVAIKELDGTVNLYYIAE